MVIKIVLLIMIIFLSTGCMSKKEIQLESLSIVNKSDIEQGYLTKKYLKHHKNGRCITKVKNRWFKKLEVSDKFLQIKFSSKEKVFKNVIEDREESASIKLQADGKRLKKVSFCPLVERNNKKYIYTYFYPITTLYSLKEINLEDEKFDLKTTNTLLFSLYKVGYSRWKTNEIVITKDMIDKLEF